jgi:hypothetical protein
MSADTLERIVELWPDLPDSARQTILDIAENTRPRFGRLALTDEEQQMLAAAREDFRTGRVLDEEQYAAWQAELLKSLEDDAP